MNFLNSSYSMVVSKNGRDLTLNEIPYFYNSISRIFLSVKTSEIMQMEITLTPSFDDAMKILESGLLGISLGKKDDKPQVVGKQLIAKPATTNRNTMTTPSDKTVISGAGTGLTRIRLKLQRPGEKTSAGKPFETPEYNGVIYQPDVSINGGEVTITLKGYGYSSLSIGPQYMVNIPDGEKTLLDVVKECLEFMDYDPNPVYMDDSVKTSLQAKAPKRDARETLFSTLKWATGLAKCGFVEDFSGSSEGKDKMGFYDLQHSSFKDKKAKYTCVQWRQVNPMNGDIPLFSFSMDSGKLLFLQGKSFGTYKGIYDPETKKFELPKEKDATTESIRSQSSQTKTDANSKRKPGLFISELDTKTSNEESKKADADFQNQAATFQRFTLQIPGVPDIYVMDQVNLRVGDVAAFQGVCLVRGVTQTLDTSGWVTDLDVVMTGGLDANVKEKNEIKISQADLRNEKKLMARSV